jgi:hypothetical protein
MRWRGCRIRSGGMQLHGIDVFVAGPGAIKTARVRFPSPARLRIKKLQRIAVRLL